LIPEIEADLTGDWPSEAVHALSQIPSIIPEYAGRAIYLTLQMICVVPKAAFEALAELVEFEFEPKLAEFEFLIGVVGACEGEDCAKAAQLANRYAAHFAIVEFTDAVAQYWGQLLRWLAESEGLFAQIACETLLSLFPSAGIEYGEVVEMVIWRMGSLAEIDDPDMLAAIAGLAAVIVDLYGEQLDGQSEDMRALAARFSLTLAGDWENRRLIEEVLKSIGAFSRKMRTICAEFESHWVRAAADHFSLTDVQLSLEIARVFLPCMNAMERRTFELFREKMALMLAYPSQTSELSQIKIIGDSVLEVLESRPP
jgi:hypothetical protein